MKELPRALIALGAIGALIGIVQPRILDRQDDRASVACLEALMRDAEAVVSDAGAQSTDGLAGVAPDACRTAAVEGWELVPVGQPPGFQARVVSRSGQRFHVDGSGDVVRAE